jgi:hypothetical protein
LIPRIVHVEKLHGPNFYALQRPRWFFKPLWYAENWSEGGDIIRFDSFGSASLALQFALKYPERWEPLDIKNFGYKIIGAIG